MLKARPGRYNQFVQAGPPRTREREEDPRLLGEGGVGGGAPMFWVEVEVAGAHSRRRVMAGRTVDFPPSWSSAEKQHCRYEEGARPKIIGADGLSRK
jgi:hypothetical protein